jgi:P27 family predicted phage terminase small subunit
MVGRKATPKEIRDLTGLKSSHPPANPKGLKVKRPIGGPPNWMTDLQKEIWREGLENAPANLLKAIDASLYQTWVFACYSQRRASQQFENGGGQMVVYSVNGSARAHPLLAVIRAEGATMLKCASEMGFTPTSRMKVKADGPDSGEDPTNPFEQFNTNGPITTGKRQKPN